ncbi:hypothetical protein J6590_029638 [Homalodisca vitripennis]|nr:hypothetical protein J6590_029638 [Homalodisca vitripennis]
MFCVQRRSTTHRFKLSDPHSVETISLAPRAPGHRVSMENTIGRSRWESKSWSSDGLVNYRSPPPLSAMTGEIALGRSRNWSCILPSPVCPNCTLSHALLTLFLSPLVSLSTGNLLVNNFPPPSCPIRRSSVARLLAVIIAPQDFTRGQREPNCGWLRGHRSIIRDETCQPVTPEHKGFTAGNRLTVPYSCETRTDPEETIMKTFLKNAFDATRELKLLYEYGAQWGC